MTFSEVHEGQFTLHQQMVLLDQFVTPVGVRQSLFSLIEHAQSALVGRGMSK